MKFIGNQDTRKIILQVGNIKGNISTVNDLIGITDPATGDLYITLDTGIGYLYDGLGWVNLGEFRGPQGIAGINGQKVDHVTRTTGTGESGTTDTYTLWGDPTETVNLGTFDLYNGKDGKSWITGTAVPNDSEGNELDLYFNLSTDHYYRKESGTWVFKGSLKGNAFSSDASGPIADRSSYDAELTGFSFLSLDEGVPTLYFKLSDTAGDWDTGTAVGKGIGIASITKTNTVGNVDTYTITYDDLSSSAFTVTNTNIDDTIISTSSVWSSSKMESELKKATPTTAFLMSRGAI